MAKAKATLYYIFDNVVSGCRDLTPENRFSLAGNFYSTAEKRGNGKFKGIGIVVSSSTGNFSQFHNGHRMERQNLKDGTKSTFHTSQDSGGIEIEMFGDRAKQYLQNYGINLHYPSN